MLSGRPLFYLKKKEKLAGMVTRWLSLSLVVPLVVTPYHSLLLFVIRCHSLSFVVTRCTTRCHSLSFVVARCTRWSRYKSNFETHAKTRSLLLVIQFTGSHRNIFLWLPVNCITIIQIQSPLQVCGLFFQSRYLISPYLANVPNLYPLKTPKTQRLWFV